ncbi:MAG: hypothetical protein LBT86_08765 [Deltaproteobacteria bacterium]|nr:hypothetical protein [Deltaproteobacteria bacterium]
MPRRLLPLGLIFGFWELTTPESFSLNRELEAEDNNVFGCFFPMNWTKIAIKKLLFLLVLAIVFLGQAYAEADSTKVFSVIRIGYVVGPDRIILERAREIARRRGQEVELVEFASPQDSLKALALGQIELSASQNQPQVDQFVLENKFSLVSLGNIYIAPLTFYSQKIKSLAELKTGDRVVMHNEPSKRSRGYRLLSQYGVIKLAEREKWSDRNDVTDNPYQLNFIEAPSFWPFVGNPSIVAMAIIGVSDDIYAKTGGSVKFSTLCQEEAASPYVNVVVARKINRNNSSLLDFLKDYQSLEMAQFLLEYFNGSIIPVYEFN